jgi:hypothetical protein
VVLTEAFCSSSPPDSIADFLYLSRAQLGEELRYLLAAADGKVVDGEGAERVDGYKDFCVRWGYGDAEKKAISNVINEVLA